MEIEDGVVFETYESLKCILYDEEERTIKETICTLIKITESQSMR